MNEEIKKIIEESISKRGIKVSKRISSGGLFSYSTYDERTVYSIEKLNELNDQGFKVDQDMGIFLYNTFMN